MKKSIYYFSGTGNSLLAASILAEKLQAQLKPMAAATGALDDEELLGLVFPTYMYRPPILVVDFLKRIPKADYLFVVAVNAGDPGDVLERVRGLLALRQRELHAAFEVAYPSNYTPFGAPPGKAEQETIFAAAADKLDRMAEVIEGQKRQPAEKPSWFRTRIHPGLLYKLGYWAIPDYDKKFWLNDNCVGCASCSRVCPVSNIEMREDKPVWKHSCQQCLACLQWCRKEAIEMGKKTEGVARYHNPKVKRRQIIAQHKG